MSSASHCKIEPFHRRDHHARDRSRRPLGENVFTPTFMSLLLSTKGFARLDASLGCILAQGPDTSAAITPRSRERQYFIAQPDAGKNWGDHRPAAETKNLLRPLMRRSGSGGFGPSGAIVASLRQTTSLEEAANVEVNFTRLFARFSDSLKPQSSARGPSGVTKRMPGSDPDSQSRRVEIILDRRDSRYR